MKLIYTTDQMPGYSRMRSGKGFSFRLPDGSLLADRRERQRLMSLAVPPAYQNVWICLMHNGHLQATGIDARGRKQYRYHAEWHSGAADRKFDMLLEFARALPRIRLRVRKELSNPDLTKDRVIAGIVALLDITGYRIGNSRYEKENRTFGLSSLLNRHIQEQDGTLHIRFRGKAGMEHYAEIGEPRLVSLIQALQDLPGQHLFRYEDDLGEWHDIGTTEVNAWLKEVGGGDFTAKQFRTWKASVLCARRLARMSPPDTKAMQDRMVREAIKETAILLNHTPATCRKYYIHPALPAAYADGSLRTTMEAPPPRLKKSDDSAGLQADERRLYKILSQTHLKKAAHSNSKRNS